MERHFEQAIQYVRDNKTWTDAEETVALQHIDHYRCPLQQASSNIASEISGLMEEYGEEHDLPEDWWREFGDEDEVFFSM